MADDPNDILVINRLVLKADAFRLRLDADPSYALSHNFLDMEIASVYDSDGLLSNLLKLVEMRPEFADARFIVGEMYLLRGDSDTARLYLTQAVKLGHPRAQEIEAKLHVLAQPSHNLPVLPVLLSCLLAASLVIVVGVVVRRFKYTILQEPLPEAG